MAALYIILGVLVIALASLFIYLFRFGVVRQPESKSDVNDDNTGWTKHKAEIDAGKEWILAQPSERLELTARDGLKLCARYIRNPDARGTIVCMHGYRSNPLMDFSASARFLYDAGFSLLLPSERAHGDSEGRYISYGVLERFDCVDWVTKVNGCAGVDGDVFLYGVSMGAATVLMASGLELPSNVRGVIADCGFTSPKNILTHVMKDNMSLPAGALLPVLNVMTRLIARFDMSGANTVDAMKSARVPVLFIHGDADTFVPTRMSRENYAACAAPKQLEIFAGAKHAESMYTEPERYRDCVLAFLNEYSTK